MALCFLFMLSLSCFEIIAFGNQFFKSTSKSGVLKHKYVHLDSYLMVRIYNDLNGLPHGCVSTVNKRLARQKSHPRTVKNCIEFNTKILWFQNILSCPFQPLLFFAFFILNLVLEIILVIEDFRQILVRLCQTFQIKNISFECSDRLLNHSNRALKSRYILELVNGVTYNLLSKLVPGLVVLLLHHWSCRTPHHFIIITYQKYKMYRQNTLGLAP